MNEIKQPKILIAGVGNELRMDDAFGVVLAKKLSDEHALPENVKVLEIGSGGISLVQELYDHYDILLILDIVMWGGEAGTVYLKEIEVKDVRQLPDDEKNEFFADMHYISPLRALMMAKALDIIPEKVLFLGCESSAHEEIGIGLSPAVSNAMPVALRKVMDWIQSVSKSEIVLEK
ncbi:MAG: hydrogenase maturation protease [Chitinophagales bacterium]